MKIEKSESTRLDLQSSDFPIFNFASLPVHRCVHDVFGRAAVKPARRALHEEAAQQRWSNEGGQWFLAVWARRLSWSEVAVIFGTSWETVFRAVERAVEWGREHVELGVVEAIGVDEIQWRLGHC